YRRAIRPTIGQYCSICDRAYPHIGTVGIFGRLAWLSANSSANAYGPLFPGQFSSNAPTKWKSEPNAARFKPCPVSWRINASCLVDPDSRKTKCPILNPVAPPAGEISPPDVTILPVAQSIFMPSILAQSAPPLPNQPGTVTNTKCITTLIKKNASPNAFTGHVIGINQLDHANTPW